MHLNPKYFIDNNWFDLFNRVVMIELRGKNVDIGFFSFPNEMKEGFSELPSSQNGIWEEIILYVIYCARVDLEIPSLSYMLENLYLSKVLPASL